MTQPLDFQSIIFTLQKFWADQGCLIWQPYYSQVGAGTYNPATFLRVLGPEPWNVGYVEPSVRADDGRYGENPNRLQQHYQFQVILKPDPGNPQELYLKSLEALGIDQRQHDIRFVEDNWESPALGAWGLGWEVWLDGQEITQFTYFQQCGGISLDPVSVEITYGLERIAMPLQRVRHFKDIRWNGEHVYGDMNMQGEQEHSRYYFDVADVERSRQLYALYEKEAELALDKSLVLPAYDYLLKCSQTFNVLDTRGVIGVTERQALFSRMREVAHRVAEQYLEQRQRLEYPWLKDDKQSSLVGASVRRKPSQAMPARPELFATPQEFLFEIGTEELPTSDLQSALAQLKERLPALLDDLRLPHSGEVIILGTPRRLVASVTGLAARQVDRIQLVKGPPASRAFDSLGLPTKAAEGFAKNRGIDVKALEVRQVDGGSYAVAEVTERGRPTVEVLSEALPKLIASIKFDKPMRWNSSNVYFSRPIRWLLALFSGQVVPFDYAGVRSGPVTRGLRFLSPAEIEVKNSQEYFTVLADQGILLDPEIRQHSIADQVIRLAVEAGGSPKLDETLLDEVNQLVEAPTGLRGGFEESHLRLPPEVLISVMKKHQRYFPVQTPEGCLLPCFIAVRNGDDRYLDIVRDDNEQVIGARYADAAFFIDQDLHHKLEDFLPRLGTLIFQTKLGSMLDKSKRIERLVKPLARFVGAQDLSTVQRAAHLCKADLVTHMVVEMTSLQGLMGRYYALHSGETEAVAQAIYEHYLPRFAGDANPLSPSGLVIGLADRLDSLAGLFAAGLAPTGTRDPFAQRRTALGMVQALTAWDLDFDLRQGLALASEVLPVPSSPEIQKACLEFIAGRLRSFLVEQENYRYDVVDAVLAAQQHNPAGVVRSVKELAAHVTQADWPVVLPAYARCVRITRDQTQQYPVDPQLLIEPAEKELYQALLKVEETPRRPGSMEDFLTTFLPIIPAISRFFEEVLVMAEDARLRANRLGLLQRIVALPKGVADFSFLEGF
ncbi:MAG: glycine--tRNA ligase subunit beta [Anaerolineaceae bacterium]